MAASFAVSIIATAYTALSADTAATQSDLRPLGAMTSTIGSWKTSILGVRPFSRFACEAIHKLNRSYDDVTAREQLRSYT